MEAVVRVSRALVASSQSMTFGVVRQGAGDGNTLLLAAGELAGVALGKVGQAHQLEQLHGALAAASPFSPRNSSGKVTLRKTVRCWNRLKFWKIMPTWLRSSSSARPDRPVISRPS